MTRQGVKDVIALNRPQKLASSLSKGTGTQDLGNEKLVLLEVGRAIAALLVVLHHADQATAHFSDVARERILCGGSMALTSSLC